MSKKKFLSLNQRDIHLRRELDELRAQYDDPPPLLRDQFKDVASFMKAVRQSMRVLVKPRCVIRACGDHNSAAILSQLLYWLDKRKDGKSRGGVKIDDEVYIANSAAEWGRQTVMSAKQATTAIKKLQELGLVRVVVKRFNCKPMRHITVVMPMLMNLVEKTAMTEHEANKRQPQDDPDSADVRPSWS